MCDRLATAFAEALHSHSAGDPLPFDAHSLFRRETDRAIKQRLGKQSLDVGADRIARTAHAALGILSEIRNTLPLVMGWTPGVVHSHQVIEVYPAATLKALGLPSSGYKGVGSDAMRSPLIEAMPQVEFEPDACDNAIASDDAFDAAVCTLAGADYAVGDAVAPTDLDLAKREGWIWVRQMAPGDPTSP